MHWIDPDYLLEISGTVDRLLANRHAELDGLILTDGTEICFPPHLSEDVVKIVRPGVMARVRGVRPRVPGIIAAIAIEVEGQRIVDNGPPKENSRKASKNPPIERIPIRAEVIVERALHGPRGDFRGVLLADGRILRFPAESAEDIAALVAPGGPIAILGEGTTTPAGIVVIVHAIGRSAGDMRQLRAKKPKAPKNGKADSPVSSSRPPFEGTGDEYRK